MKRIGKNSSTYEIKEIWSDWISHQDEEKFELLGKSETKLNVQALNEIYMETKKFGHSLEEIELIKKFIYECSDIRFHDWVYKENHQSKSLSGRYTTWRCSNCGISFKQHSIDNVLEASIKESQVPLTCEDIIDPDMIYQNEFTIKKIKNSKF